MTKSVNIFTEDGVLKNYFSTFEARPEQSKMASLVTKALAESKHCLVEAGTGTGKSLAYLFPVALSGNKTVITTGTKNLQHQLIHKDIPLVVKVIKDLTGRSLKIAEAKGRGNFLCARRFDKYMNNKDMFNEFESELKKIKKWKDKTNTGDFDDLDFEIPIKLKSKICSSSVDCINKKCPHMICGHFIVGELIGCNKGMDKCLSSDCEFYEPKCFRGKRKAQIADADIIVANHSLYMIDIFEPFNVLPNHQVVIIDEAHHAYEKAVDQLSLDFSNFRMRDLVNDIRALKCYKTDKMIEDSLLFDIVKKSDDFFNQFISVDTKSKIYKYTIKEYDEKLLDDFVFSINQLQSALEQVKRMTDTGNEEYPEISNCVERCEDLVDELTMILNIEDKDHVSFVEVIIREDKMNTIQLRCCPLDVSRELREELFDIKKSVILTSATIAIGKDFTFFKRRLGINDKDTVEDIIGTPFDYKTNCCLFLPKLDPKESNFVEKVSDMIKKLVKKSNGNAFCLFTSYAVRDGVAKRLKGNIDYPLLVQGDKPRPKLIEEFLNTDNSVLLGNSSFWEGVSIEGEKLSAIIIDKIPFPQPDPLMDAQIERAKLTMGSRWFNDFYLPMAIIKLKQGFGRLIRTKTDKGFVVILDSRMKTQSYGKTIIKSLPPAMIVDNIDDLEKIFK